MKERQSLYGKISRTINANPKARKQCSITDILQGNFHAHTSMNVFQFNGDRDSGTFIPSMGSHIHLHIDIRKPHLQIGVNTYDIKGRHTYSHYRLRIARIALIKEADSEARTKCLRWINQEIISSTEDLTSNDLIELGSLEGRYPPSYPSDEDTN